jgi:hypothetical protein
VKAEQVCEVFFNRDLTGLMRFKAASWLEFLPYTGEEKYAQEFGLKIRRKETAYQT